MTRGRVGLQVHTLSGSRPTVYAHTHAQIRRLIAGDKWKHVLVRGGIYCLNWTAALRLVFALSLLAPACVSIVIFRMLDARVCVEGRKSYFYPSSICSIISECWRGTPSLTGFPSPILNTATSSGEASPGIAFAWLILSLSLVSLSFPERAGTFLTRWFHPGCIINTTVVSADLIRYPRSRVPVHAVSIYPCIASQTLLVNAKVPVASARVSEYQLTRRHRRR